MKGNTQSQSPPWASGPGEILKHGLSLLKNDTDTNRRLALISIDNAVELTAKTFLSLPSRITGIKVPRGEFEEMSMSFPKLLDGLDKYCKAKMAGIDLGEIEWYHRLRNELYHNGNGLTVERARVEVYAELAKVFFVALFGAPILDGDERTEDELGKFLVAWIKFEKTLAAVTAPFQSGVAMRNTPMAMLNLLHKRGIISDREREEIKDLRGLRNDVVHASVPHDDKTLRDSIERLSFVTRVLQSKMPE